MLYEVNRPFSKQHRGKQTHYKERVLELLSKQLFGEGLKDWEHDGLWCPASDRVRMLGGLVG